MLRQRQQNLHDVSREKIVTAIENWAIDGSAAASGIAWINGIGNLGGFFGPTAVGWIKIMTGSFSSGLYLLAGMAVVSAVSTFWLDIKNPVAERELASVPAE
jgi:nitrate/nitrite transporter NarK